jgi:hypothetical protein
MRYCLADGRHSHRLRYLRWDYQIWIPLCRLGERRRLAPLDPRKHPNNAMRCVCVNFVWVKRVTGKSW